MSVSSIVLTGGGTAGHVMPNLALLPYLRERFSQIYYIGEKGGIEQGLAEKKGLEFFGITCVKFDRSRLLVNCKIPFLLSKGVKEAENILKDLNADIVFAKGGFVSLPVTIAAKRLGVPYALHESDISLGLANKLMKRSACKIFTSFEGTVKGEIVSGNPIRDEIFKGEKSRAPIFSNDRPIVFVVGGSTGASVINEVVSKSRELLDAYNVIHLCGKNKGDKLKNDAPEYCVMEYSSNIEDLYAAADVVVTRAGANALAELTALGKRVIAIPLPKNGSRGDQGANAEYYRKRGLIDVLEQAELTPSSLKKAVDISLARAPLSPTVSRAAEVIAEELYLTSLRQKS